MIEAFSLSSVSPQSRLPESYYDKENNVCDLNYSGPVQKSAPKHERKAIAVKVTSKAVSVSASLGSSFVKGTLRGFAGPLLLGACDDNNARNVGGNQVITDTGAADDGNGNQSVVDAGGIKDGGIQSVMDAGRIDGGRGDLGFEDAGIFDAEILDGNIADAVDTGDAYQPECVDDQTITSYSGPAETRRVGQCRDEIATCQNGNWAIALEEVLPKDEGCNNLDDDCDGIVDNDLVRLSYSGPQRTAGMGQCRYQIETCSEGSWEIIQDEVTPKQEVCNNLDDDCEGQIDNNIPARVSYSGPAETRNVGECKDRIENCQEGNWRVSREEVLPQAEVCNGLNDDCDWAVDEDLSQVSYSGPAGTQDVGNCRPRIEDCVNGRQVISQEEVRPVAEVCNNQDDNCDGRKDNNIPARVSYSGPAETRNVGECKDRIENCQEGNWQVSRGEVLPQAEVCNGLDDNCDGQIDEGLTQTTYSGPNGTQGIGQCKSQVRECRNGNFVVTQQEVLPQPEICNGLNDNCDGQIDENLTQISYLGPQWTENVGACKPQISECRNGDYVITQQEILPGQEICNNLDDDCDGQTDEDLTRTSYSGQDETSWVGVCRDKIETCQTGNWIVTQEEILPQVETCNNLDDDCNGQTDEELTQTFYSGSQGTENIGICKPEIRVCQNGVLVITQPEVLPQEESYVSGNIANGLDDNCNGRTDEIAVDGITLTLPGDSYGVGIDGPPSYIAVTNGGRIEFTSPNVIISTPGFYVDSTSSIDISAVTCGDGNGAFGQGNADGGGGGAGSHIGRGGNGGNGGWVGIGGPSGINYGSIEDFEAESGSCGGNGASEGGVSGMGGGALTIEANYVYIYGTISSNGGNGGNGWIDGGGGGGGSGGAISINANNTLGMRSSSILSVVGGNGGTGGREYAEGGGGGGGGGGSIEMQCFGVVSIDNFSTPAMFGFNNFIDQLDDNGSLQIFGGIGGIGRLNGQNGQPGVFNTSLPVGGN